MTTSKNPKGKRGFGHTASTNPYGSFKSRLMGKQRDHLRTNLTSRMIPGPIGTRSVGSASNVTLAFTLRVTPANYKQSDRRNQFSAMFMICKHQRCMCFEQDVTSAFNSLTETAETTKARKAQKALDKANQSLSRRLSRELAART